MKVLILSCVLAFGLVGCAAPVTKVNVIDSRPTLSFAGVPKDSFVLIDGVNGGDASQYDGKPKVLIVEPGTHEITIIVDNKPVFSQTVFVDSEHKVINVH